MTAWLSLSALWSLCSARALQTVSASLPSCLAQAGVPFLVSDSSDWAGEIMPYNVRLNYTPAAVAMPQSVAQIQAAVSCGVRNRARITAKGGGHSFGSFGLGGEDGHLVIGFEHMRRVVVKDDNTATIQAGARLLDVATELYNQGRRALPHGSVGIAGHVLHGGFGYASRTHGLTLDWLTGATVVLADASVVHCSAIENQDLFWALRGAGSSFGIVAEFEFDTFEAPNQVTSFSLDLPSWERADAVEAISSLQRFAVSAPRELNLMLDITPTDKTFQGVYYGNQRGLHEALRPLLSDVGGNFSSASTVGWLEGLLKFDDLDPADPRDTFYATSLVTRALDGGQIESLVSSLAAASPPSLRRSLYLSIEAHGGINSAVADVGSSATAYPHRDKLLLFQLFHGGSQGRYDDNGFGLVETVRRSVTDSVAGGEWGMYSNYLDTQLDAPAAGELYWGSNLPRLRRIKADLDPYEVFWNPQGIQPADSLYKAGYEL
ncbi:hypothetical protein CDD83_5965 [Cordyceps sp. RAO-2017]|nr:hypothetical protein CDD83_5965 [Cordyceps sp. RAO-2017]